MLIYLFIYEYKTLIIAGNMTCSRQQNYEVSHLSLNGMKPGQTASQSFCNTDSGHSSSSFIIAGFVSSLFLNPWVFQNVILFRNRVYNGNQVKMGSFRMGFNPMTAVLIKRGNLDTETVAYWRKTVGDRTNAKKVGRQQQKNAWVSQDLAEEYMLGPIEMFPFHPVFRS